MNNKYLIGLDFGSDSVRCLIIDAKNGTSVSSAVAVYPRWAEGMYCSPEENRYRQHPLDYLESMEKCIREALGKCGKEVADNVVGIGYDTTASTPALTGRDGLPLALYPEHKDNPDAMFVLWKDHTAIREADEINAAIRTSPIDYAKYSGGSYSCEWAWAKMLHCLRNSPELMKDTWSWAEHCDWTGAVLTGNLQPEKMARSRCCAGHKALWNKEWGGLPDMEFFERIDPAYSVFRGHTYTETITSDHCIGTLTPEWAARLGLKENVKVSIGAIDCHVGAVGAGIRPGTLVKVIGTSTCDIMVASPEETGNAIVHGICGQVDGSVLPGFTGYEAGQAAFGDLYAWFRKFMSWPFKFLGCSGKGSPEASAVSKDMLELLTREAAEIKVTENDPVSLDWFNGRRTPDLNPELKGAVSGLTLSSSAPLVFKSLVEATAFGARAINERLEQEGAGINEIIAIGGIAKKSPYVMQILADVLGKEIRVADSDQACALGAGIFAAVAAGIYKDVREAQQRMSSPAGTVYIPDNERHAIYNILYRRYLDLGQAII